MKTKHTPAPWEADNTGFGKMQIWNVKEARMDFNDLHLIATIHSVEVKGVNQLKANAKLIAAAPELFGALEELMKVYERNGQLLSFDVNIARNAIKKATE